jgi:hypothetical protein
MKRTVFVCDLKLPLSPFSLNDTMTIEIADAWIEKTWRKGYWFWTTIPGNNDFQVIIRTRQLKGNWIIKNKSGSGFGGDVLGYHDGELSGHIADLPESDTLKYFVLGQNKLIFDEQDIIGEIKFVLVKPDSQ